MANIKSSYKEDCGCGRCSTWAEITEYDCDCVKVEIFNDSDPCDECTNFSAKREYCNKSGNPDNH